MHDNKLPTMNLIDTIAAHSELSTFSELLAASGIEELFGFGGEFTVFAPNNDAFRKLDPRRLMALLYDSDKTNVRNLVLFHVCMGKMEVVAESAPTTVDYGTTSAADSESGTRKRNIGATNGIIHEIGTVLTPATSPCVKGH